MFFRVLYTDKMNLEFDFFCFFSDDFNIQMRIARQKNRVTFLTIFIRFFFLFADVMLLFHWHLYILEKNVFIHLILRII